jgi:hypothetical protein
VFIKAHNPDREPLQLFIPSDGEDFYPDRNATSNPNDVRCFTIGMDRGANRTNDRYDSAYNAVDLRTNVIPHLEAALMPPTMKVSTEISCAVGQRVILIGFNH